MSEEKELIKSLRLKITFQEYDNEELKMQVHKLRMDIKILRAENEEVRSLYEDVFFNLLDTDFYKSANVVKNLIHATGYLNMKDFK